VSTALIHAGSLEFPLVGLVAAITPLTQHNHTFLINF
jgi:hypothetical protein